MLLHSAWVFNKFCTGFIASPEPARIIEVQITEMQLKQPNLG